MALWTNPEDALLDVTGKTSSFNSDSAKIEMPGFSVQAEWTEEVASLAGTIKLQGRIGEDMQWCDLTGTEETISGSGKFLWNLREQHYIDFRIAVTISSGKGAFKARYSAKAIS